MTKILVADDDSHVVKLLKHVLQSNGYDVLTCSGGQNALDLAVQSNPQLIILDAMMPVIDGYQVLWHLGNRAETRDIPTIMLSSRSSSQDVHQGLKLGAREYMFKPFSVYELLNRVDNVLTNVQPARELALAN